MMLRLIAAMCLAALVATACSSVRESSPERTATEQLLISTAIDRAADKLNLEIPPGTRVFLDAGGLEGPDARYAASVVKDRILRSGAHIALLRNEADAVVELRAGALSIDDGQTLVGVPNFDVPIPLAGPMAFPEVPFYKQKERKGVAKLAATSYWVSDGRLIDSTGPQFGYSHEREDSFIMFSWRRSDLPEESEPGLFDPW